MTFSQKNQKKVNKISTLYASLNPVYNNFDEFLKKLSPKRQERILAMKDFDARVNSLGGALLLNEAAKRFGVDADSVCYTKDGKPYVNDCDFHFSISHSKGYAACSFGKIPSGCDIQLKQNANLKVTKRFFLPKEQQKVFSSKNPEDEFFKVWCRKESSFKLIGNTYCTEENSQGLHFKEYTVLENLHLVVCAYENMFNNPERLNLNIAF